MGATVYPILAKHSKDAQCEVGDIWVSFTTSPPTSVQGLTEITLHPGRVDAMALEFFAHGACCVLAGAIHELSGWPLVAFKRVMDGQIYPHAHMGVMTPDVMILDITGVRSYASVRQEYGEVWAEHVTLEEAVRSGSIHPAGWGAGLDDLVREVVRYFADQLVSQADASQKRSSANP